jgi:hypothetical protein
MPAARSKLEGASEGLFWFGLVLAVISPFLTFIGAGLIGAGHGSPVGYYAGLGLSGVAWLAFLASFSFAIIVHRRGNSGLWLLSLPSLGVFVYPFVWYCFFRAMFS